ncbi:MAG: FAD-binding oxidoreductase, partial [Methylococcales bacterium]|nr:FAD-binding oxidoreductase [Methylococcales bacterium]
HQAVVKAFSESQISFAGGARLLHSHGQTTVGEVYQVLYRRLPRSVDMVFWPESDDDVMKIVKLAQEHDVCLVPFGGGTSVSAALKLPTTEQEPRMVTTVDMRRMNKVIWLDKRNQLAEVQAGITGTQLETALTKEGYTSGHEPDSMELSTLGGWIATNASGMKKNKYGNIEDIVKNVTMITPNGIIEHSMNVPRASIGIQPKDMVIGSEGNLGLITKAVIRVPKLPEVVKFGSIVFPNFETGIEYLEALNHTGVLPASIRLMDNIQFRFGAALKPEPTGMQELMSKIEKFALTKVKKFDPYKLAVARVVMEGSKEEVAYQNKIVFNLAKKFNGISGGEGNGKRGYMLTYAIAYLRDYMADYHIIGETYETTVPWSKIHDVLNAVDKRSLELHREHGFPGHPYVSPRITQLYHTGVCIYFTHAFSIKGIDNADEIFGRMDHELREVILAAGGSVSHHHGVGKLRKDFMPQAISPASIKMIKELKKANDPQNIFGIRNNALAL